MNSKFLEIKKVLIIGSKGFIGSNLKTYLKEKELEVWGADVVTDYTSKKYFIIDASNSDYHHIFDKEEFDICINCSGAASVPDSLQHPLRDFSLNSLNVFKLLDAIKTYQPTCKFINLSSAAVYGNPKELPIIEKMKSNPVSPYGFHKMMSEQICNEYAQFFNVHTCSLRIFSAYGEGLQKQLFWDLYQKTKLGKEIELWGTGKESRDFIYIKDLLQAIYLVAQNADFKGEIINIANGEEVFIEDCVKTFYNFFDKKIDYKFSGEGRKGDPNNWVADITILKEMGYQQKYSLKDGLNKYFQWAKAVEKE